MSITTDPTTSIGKVRLYGADSDLETYMFDDVEISVFLSDAGGHIKLASYYCLAVKLRNLAVRPEDRTIGNYSEGYNVEALRKALAQLKTELEEEGVGTDGNDLLQYGFAEISRDKNSYKQVEKNKAARGETY